MGAHVCVSVCTCVRVHREARGQPQVLLLRHCCWSAFVCFVWLLTKYMRLADQCTPGILLSLLPSIHKTQASLLCLHGSRGQTQVVVLMQKGLYLLRPLPKFISEKFILEKRRADSVPELVGVLSLVPPLQVLYPWT